MSAVNREDNASEKAGASPVMATADVPKPPQRVTPLPMHQMLPMTFVLLNESLCSTMLLPFVGLLVSHLADTPVEEAGYTSGMLVGVFMLGQMVSAKPWGWMSDNYGRRFPLISGLFTSGLMMLGFGLSSSVWMCALFRFFHGLFNGNVLVAKTMMADITDKTNQAKGFAFVSLCYGIGVLIGPTLGGLLYDPATSSAMRWAHIGKDSIFGRYPALLPSLIIFVYTNVGMLICTFCVMESNPHAKPLPRILKCLYPCFWREPEQFVHPTTMSAEDDAKLTTSSGSAANTGDEDDDDDGGSGMLGMSIQRAESLVANVSMTRAVASLEIASPVRREGRRFDALVASETLATATRTTTAVTPRYGQSTLSRMQEETALHEASASEDDTSSSSIRKPNATLSASTDKAALTEGTHPKREGDLMDVDDGGVAIAVPEDSAESTAAPIKRFGYKQAFGHPITRMILVIYMLLSAADMAVHEILPLWAIASVSVGGLGFGADKVGYILLTNSVPCVAANLQFHRACLHFENKLSLYRLSLLCTTAAVCVLPLISYLDLGGYAFIAVVMCTSVRQFFSSWCYGVATMLTARSAPDGHIGAIMGINQSCGALMRTLAPFLVTPLFAWSLTSHHPFPFNHVFVFLLSAVVFVIGYVYSEGLRTDADAQLEAVEEYPPWMEKIRQTTVGCYQKVTQAVRGAFASCRSH